MKNNIHKKFLALRSLARSSLSRFASVILTAIVLSGCGGGGGDSGGNPVAASVVAPNGVRIVEASSTSTTSITVSWLAVSDDTTPAADIRYELHASTDPVFTPATSTLKFSGKGQYTAQINGLSANTQYTVRLVAIDGQGNAAPSNAYTVTTATVDPTLRSDATVYPISESLPVIVDSNSVTLPTAQAAAVQVGQFIAGSTADGYLREVIGLSTQGTNTILQTQPASVNNVLENFQVSSRISMEAMPDSTSTQQAAVAASLARPLATAQTNYTMAWPQSGLRMSSTDAAPHRVSIKAQSAQLTAAVSTPMSSSFDISATQVTESGKFAKVTAPAAVGVVGGKSGEFTVVINKLQDDIDHNIFSPDETSPLTVCEVRLKGITSPDGKNADGLVQVLALESQQTDAATGAIKVAHNQIRVTATEAQIAAGFYKVILRTY